MQVFVGVGSDPLWTLGPAFMGNDEAARPVRGQADTYVRTGKKAHTRSLDGSWETLPSPTLRAAPAPTQRYASVQEQMAAHPNDNGLTALLRWFLG